MYVGRLQNWNDFLRIMKNDTVRPGESQGRAAIDPGYHTALTEVHIQTED